MAYDYGYGELNNRLIELFKSGAPDFETAKELINQGADLNAVGKDDGENILSEILIGYHCTESGDICHNECDDCEKDNCDECEFHINLNPNLGQSMCDIIRFFLDNGFNVTKNEGCFGAQCLYALTLSTFDKYMIEATKILFGAGAVNRTVSLNPNESATPWNFIGTEGSFQGTCEGNHALANIFEAVYQIYLALDEGRPYQGIDSYEISVGKRIIKVLAENNGGKSGFYPINTDGFKKDNCYTDNLYFVYDGGALVTTQYADFWTDTVIPDKEIIDVSERFKEIIGETIKSFAFDHRSIIKGTTEYGQPITTIETVSGNKVCFSINFGEVKDDNRAAYFEFLN